MNFAPLLSALFKVFALILAGYFLNRKKILDSRVNAGLSALIVYLTDPALIIASSCVVDPLEKGMVLRLLFLGIGIYLFLPLLAWVLVRLFRIPRNKSGAVSLLLIFSNTGFMAIPVLKALYGDVVVFYSSILNLPFSLLIFSYGLFLLTRDRGEGLRLSWKEFLSPGILSSILALIIYFTGLRLPGFLQEALSFVGDTTPPLSMVLLGSILAEYPLKGLLSDRKLNVLMVLKLTLVPLAIFPLAYAVFGGNPELVGYTTLTFAMPAATLSAMLCKQYGGETRTATVGIIFSTALSMFTIPLIYWLLTLVL